MSSVNLTAVTRIKLTFLYKLAQKYGSMRALADHLGVSQQMLGGVANLKEFPLWLFNEEDPRTMRLNALCLENFSRGLEELLPKRLRRIKGLFPKKIERSREFDTERLISFGEKEIRKIGYNPLDNPEMSVAECIQTIEKIADTPLTHYKKPNKWWDKGEAVTLPVLTPRQKGILLGTAEGLTLKEIGAKFDISPERARQILYKAESKIRSCRDPEVKKLKDKIVASMQEAE